MAFTERDLFHRRPAAASSIRKTVELNNNCARRKKRTSSKDQFAAIGVIALGVAIPFGLIVLIVSRRGGETAGAISTTSEQVRDGSRFLKQWKPRLRMPDERLGGGSIMHNNDEKSSSSKRANVDKLQADSKEDRKSIYRYKFSASELGYDIYNCPPTPPDDYPRAWPVTDIISNWNPNDVNTVPPSHRDVYHSLCIFDYQAQYDTALAYRNAEKPFIVRNDPKVIAASKKWSSPNYLLENLPQKKMYTERSPVNHFMFYNPSQRKNYKNWVQPVNDVVSMTLAEWLERSLERDAIALSDGDLKKRVETMRGQRMERGLLQEQQEKPEDDEIKEDFDREEEKRHNWYYWRLNAFLEDVEKDGHSKLTFEDMPFFDPRKEEESAFYLVDPSDQRGINCRFGMRGVIAESHCDLSRNMIALLDGERRYIIGHPDQCENLYLYPRGHPSGRHASFDWSNPSNWDTHPKFRNALHSEVVMKAGDVMYLPTAWFHHIINLSTNIQCNIRSGISYENKDVLKECGFKLPK